MLRTLALLLTVFTGVSGLVYEVTWERMLAVLLGSHAEATAAVLAFFLGGLAIGYSLFGRLSLRITAAGNDTARRLLLAYAAVEAAIGLYALAFEPLFNVARAISPLGPEQAALAFAWDAAGEKNAMAAIAEFKKADPSMDAFFSKAYGYAVFPEITKGGIGIGGAGGDGTVFEQGAGVGSSEMSQVTVGLQAGGQTYSEAIFFCLAPRRSDPCATSV